MGDNAIQTEEQLSTKYLLALCVLIVGGCSKSIQGVGCESRADMQAIIGDAERACGTDHHISISGADDKTPTEKFRVECQNGLVVYLEARPKVSWWKQ